MFKGTTTIELTDVSSGAVETYTDSNMVTNALTEIFRPLGYVKDPTLMYSHMSDTSYLLGGLLCFDESLEENAENLYAPASANPVACGVYNVQNTTVSTQRGHYNVSESVITPEAGYVKYVWDFQTAQGNGIIKSVCLTSALGGYCGYGSEDATRCYTGSLFRASSGNVMDHAYSTSTGGNTVHRVTTSMTVGTTEFFFALDPENDVALYFRVNVGLQSISIIRRRAWLKSVSVFHPPLTDKPMVVEQEIPLNFTFSTTANVTYNFDAEDSTLSICTASATTKANGATFDLVQINVDTAEAKGYTVSNNTGVTISTSARYATCHRGFLLVRGSVSPFNLYKIEIGNWTNVEQFTFEGISTLSGTADFVKEGRVYYNNGATQFAIANLASMTVRQSEHTHAQTVTTATAYIHYPIIGHPTSLAELSSSATTGICYFVTQGNYLATINNLSTSVTKTDEKTMKITYIIEAGS